MDDRQEIAAVASWFSRMLSRWLGGAEPAGQHAVPDAGIERELRRLERAAASAPHGSGGQFLNRAGDVCHSAGLADRALDYYGRAIDTYLEGGRYDAASAVCRKLLRIRPGVVRARCTLAWLSIGKSLESDARRDLEEYVRAARAADQEAVARRQLRMMADAVGQPVLRERIGELLVELGDTDGLADIDPESAADPEEHWRRVLRAALMGPKEVLAADRAPTHD